MRAACYARYSTDLQRATSIEDQLAVASRYAEQQGWAIDQSHIYTDAAVSGASVEGRPGLQALLRDVATTPPPFDVLLVDDSSRVSRDLSDAVRVLQQLTFFGVRVIYISQNIDSHNEQAETLVAVHGVVDSLYLREMAKKTKRGLAGQLRRGLSTGGRTFGYRTSPVFDASGRQDSDGHPTAIGHSLHVHDGEARIVRRIFEEYANGSGVGMIVDRLTRDGERGWKGHAWRYAAVSRILRNERYRGTQIWGQRTFDRKPGTRQQVVRSVPRAQWEVLDRPDLRIVSDDLWERVQARIRDVNAHVTRQPGRSLMRGGDAALHSRHLFAGLLTCAVCGSSLTAVTSGHGSPRYGCRNSWKNGTSTCDNRLTVRAKVADAAILDGLRAELLRPELVQYVTGRLAAALNDLIDNRPRLRSDLVAKHAAVEDRLRNLVDAVEEGGPAPALVRAIEAREAELRTLAARLGEMEEPLRDKLAVLPGWVQRQLEDTVGLLTDAPERTKTELRRLGVNLTVEPVRNEGPRSFLRVVGGVSLANLGFSQCLSGSTADLSHPR